MGKLMRFILFFTERRKDDGGGGDDDNSNVVGIGKAGYMTLKS